MKETGKRENLADRLAEFTDQVLAGKRQQIESEVDDELRRLEEAILQLKRAVPHTPLDEVTLKRMQANLKARLRNGEERTKVNFRQIWFRANKLHPQFAFALCALLILVFALFIAPHLTQTGPSMSAVATRPSPFVSILALLAGVTLLVIWISHRK
jgi:hypothetical protein